MRICSTALQNFLHGANYTTVLTDLYTFHLSGSEFLRYTSGNLGLLVPTAAFPDPNGLNFGFDQSFALGPRFGRSKITTKVGIEPAELDIEVLAGAGDIMFGSLTFADAVRVGLFDGATVELDRLFGTSPTDTSLGTMIWFYGRVAECEIGRSKILIKVKSLMNLLAIQQMPRRLFMASCNLVFGGPGCDYNRVTGVAADGTPGGPGQITVTADTGTGQGFILCTAPVPVAYVEGTVTGATGLNAGFKRSISNNGTGSQIGLFKPFLYPIAVGDTFTLLPGCDHSMGAGGCAGRNNLARYGGFPYVPPPEAAA